MTPAPDNVVPLPTAAETLVLAADTAVDELDELWDDGDDRQLTESQHFVSLYVRRRSSIEMQCRSFLSDRRDIEEVVQETFLRLFLAMPEIQTERQAMAFARRVCTNLCIDRYRAARRRPLMVALDSSSAFDLSDEDESDPIIQAENAAIVREALAQLNPLQRSALIKREIEEKPLPQIAAELGVPEQNVKHLLHRARAALRRLLVGTAADPHVDLSWGEMVDVARQRAARASATSLKSLLVFLVAIATGVPLLRALDENGGMFAHPGTEQTLPAAPSEKPSTSAPAGSTARGPHLPLPLPLKHAATHHAGAAAAPVASQPASTGTHDSVPPATAKPGRHGRRVGTSHRPHVSVPPPVTPSQPPPVTPASPYVLRVEGQALPTAVVRQVSTTSNDVTTSSSALATTDQAPGYTFPSYVLNQTVTFQRNVRQATGVNINLLIPTVAGQSGYVLSTSAVTQNQAADGSVTVHASGVATTVAPTPGAPTQISIDADVSYAPDLTAVKRASVDLSVVGTPTVAGGNAGYPQGTASPLPTPPGPTLPSPAATTAIDGTLPLDFPGYQSGPLAVTGGRTASGGPDSGYFGLPPSDPSGSSA